VGFVVDKVALGRFSPSTSVSPANIIQPLLHIHLSPPHEVCDCYVQAARYHNLGPKLGASLLTLHIGWKQKKKERKNRITPSKYDLTTSGYGCLSTDQNIFVAKNPEKC
jgi:hypothetical protein